MLKICEFTLTNDVKNSDGEIILSVEDGRHVALFDTSIVDENVVFNNPLNVENMDNVLVLTGKEYDLLERMIKDNFVSREKKDD